MTNKDFIKLLLISIGCDKKYEIDSHRTDDGSIYYEASGKGDNENQEIYFDGFGIYDLILNFLNNIKENPDIDLLNKLNYSINHLPQKYLLDDNERNAVYEQQKKATKETERYIEETTENKLDLLQQLKDYFDNTPREVVEKEWHEYDKYNEIGPTVDEYLEYVNKIRQPKYPKTFIECCEILYPNENFQTASQPIKGHNGKKLFILQKLLICRDAYWKIAGEQMELDKPWEPDWSTESEVKYVIEVYRNNVGKNSHGYSNTIFAFPTTEMRDAFKENFDDDIEFCKEFL